MKKLSVLISLILILGASAFADHPQKLMGIGLVAGGNYGGAGAGGDIGVSLKLESMPIFWGLNLALSENALGLRVTGDKYLTDETLFKQDGFKLDWYFGVGGYASLGLGSGSASLAAGARLPVGVSYHINKKYEVWLGIAPSLGIVIAPLHFPDWGVPGELGFRMWM